MAQNPFKGRLLRIYQSLLHHFGPQGWWPGKSRFEVIVGAILAQNTAWANVEKALANLRAQGALRVEGFSSLSFEELARLIVPSGYYTIKAKRLQAFLDFLRERYGGNLGRMFKQDPSTLRDELLAVPGIGEETADSILLYAGRHPTFVVDAYTKRVLRRHGLIDQKASYQEVQRLFLENLPPDTALFNEYHALFVAVGKCFCLKEAPRCDNCPLKWDLKPPGGPS
ncbi:MAG: endonuclease III domain-containing protein [Candidatus Methylomirabilales bacterium]